MTLNGEEYFYIRNAQNDIIALTDKNGQQVVTYNYDTWGKLISIDGSLKDSVGVRNPYRYKGYRYDGETGLYYLNARYYNPNICRMLNADTIEVLTTSFNSLGDKNLFNYCDNNPVSRDDEEGELWGTIGTIACKALLGGVVSAGIEISAQLLNNGGDIKDVDLKKVGMSFLSGTVSGAVAAIPLPGKFTVDVVMGGFSNLAGDLAVGEIKNLSDVGKSFGKGMFFSAVVSSTGSLVEYVNAKKFKKLNRSGKKNILQKKVFNNKGKHRNSNLKRYAGSMKFNSYIARNSEAFMRFTGFALDFGYRMKG